MKMSSSTSLQGLWSRATKRVPGVEAGKVGMEETSPPAKLHLEPEAGLAEDGECQKSDPTTGADMQADAPMEDVQGNVTELASGGNEAKGQAGGKKRKNNPGSQAGAKRTKQTSIWTYPSNAIEEAALLQAAGQESDLLLQDLNGQKPLLVTPQAPSTDLRRCVGEQIEESSLPYGTLAQAVLERVTNGGQSITPAAIKSTILSLAERVNYGIQDADADILEDAAANSCWRWEVRELKFLGEGVRDEILDRRKFRRKVSERLTSLTGLSGILNDKASSPADRKAAFSTAAASLKKQDDRAAIAHFAEDLAQKREAKQRARDAKNAAKEAERAAKAQEKETQKLEKETEKDKQRAEKEAERLKLKEEKERERAEKEAEKERLRAEKEAQRQEKESAREKEEAEKERLKAEKEAQEQKKKQQVKKSASLMDRFLIKRRPSDVKKDASPEGGSAPSPKGEGEAEGKVVEGKIESEMVEKMDKEFAEQKDLVPAELKRSYVESFRKARPALKHRPRSYWGVRRAPKRSVQQAIRLAGDPFAPLREPKPQPVKGKGEAVVDVSDDDDDMEEENDIIDEGQEKPGREKRRGRYKLLQLGEMGKTCNRPPYYGTWSRKSNSVIGRQPLALDSELDYEVDSDEEWEEEDPGESLSSSDKEDNEEDDKQGGYGSEDEEDGFVVPSGYLSQDEGIDLDSPTRSPAAPDPTADAAPIIDEHVASTQKLQRKLEKATKVALRKSQPLIVSALLPPLSGDQAEGVFVFEGNQAFLQAMAVHVLRSDVCVEVPAPTPTGLEEEPVVVVPGGEGKKAVQRPRGVLPEEKVPELIEFLLASTNGMARNVDELSGRFPGVTKKHLEQRIRELADYEGGRWQVKAAVLAKHGLSPLQQTPAPTVAPQPGQEETPKSRPTPRILPITKFFTKVSSSSHSGRSGDRSKGGQSEKSPNELEGDEKCSQEVKSTLQHGTDQR